MHRNAAQNLQDELDAQIHPCPTEDDENNVVVQLADGSLFDSYHDAIQHVNGGISQNSQGVKG